MEKLEWRGYSTVKKMRIYVTVYTQYRRVADGRTDGQTDGQTYASRGKNPLPMQGVFTRKGFLQGDITEIGNRLHSYGQKRFLKW